VVTTTPNSSPRGSECDWLARPEHVGERQADRPSRRTFLKLSVGLGLFAALQRNDTRAQSAYPTKPVRVIVPYAAGGGADTLCRTVFGKLSEDFGQQFIVENRAGAGGTIGAAAVAKSPADGYTTLYDATAYSVNPSLLPNLPYDPRKDFQPVFLVGVLPLLLLVHPSVDAKTVTEVIAIAKATPDGINWASAGNGSLQHLALELFRTMAGVKLNHVPYKGGAPALTDLTGGHINFYFSNTAASSSYVKAGSVRAIAHTGRDRLAEFPDLPRISDTLRGFEAYEWNGVFVRTGTPKEVIDRLNTGLNKVINDPKVMERLASLGVQAHQNSPSEFGVFVASEMEKWGKVVREANVKPD
jgi:tripartite-type tricarboxylate transporter receptor subunit TctC